MAKLTQQQCDRVTHRYFLINGWLPSGTTDTNWKVVTMAQMEFDDPPLPSRPHLQKERIARDLQDVFFIAGAKLRSPLALLKDKAETLGGLAAWSFKNHS